MITPDFIKPLDIEKERKSIVEEFKKKSNKLDYIPLVGDDYMTLIDIFLYRVNNFIELLNFKIANNYLNFSSNEYLDELVKLIGIERIKATKPIAEVEIAVSSPTFLPKGTKFTDGKGHYAYLLDSTNIQKTAICKIELDGYTDEQYETTVMEIPNIYVTQITMKTPFRGFKALESDEELRRRFLLSLHRFSTAGSEKSYLFYVLNVEGIKRANVYQQSAGVVKIIYFSEYDAVTAETKIKESLKERVPLTDQIILAPANKIMLDLKITIEPEFDRMYPEIVKSADSKIKEFFKNINIAECPHNSKIIDIAFDTSTRSVVVNSTIPKVTRDDILILNSLVISKAI